MASPKPLSNQVINWTGFVHKPGDAPWFHPKPNLPWPARQLLEEYSGIHPQNIHDQVLNIRNRAWDAFPFPCIGSFEFLDFQLSQRNLLYPRLLQRLQAGGKFLDIGCCLGHDIRKLVFDGVPGENLTGVELRKEFIELGYELFRDRDRLEAKMYQGDVQLGNSEQPWKELGGQFDVVNLGMILHSFAREGQIVCIEKAIGSLKNQVGTSIIGTACGAAEGEECFWHGNIPSHNTETFRALVKDLEERTGTKWEVDAKVDSSISLWNPKHTWLDPRVRGLAFEMTRLE
ncbi:methyltransferase domain-containing protein [Immersiella caudata]|uniref:Methyltransferase domain-containing protein n=1 Tax=Immersiella caudata TaxID=314043 RepID=A0AA39WYJ7_9PEZI|nr:methyltransferase domain-containing protein [Immersiella caudata]